MAKEINIPKLGMSMREAKIVEWKAQEGAELEESQVVLVIETDKVNAEVEAPSAGFLHIMVEEGIVLPVGGVAGQIAETKDELSKLQAESPAPVAAAGEAAAPAAAAAGAPAPAAAAAANPAGPQKGKGRAKISPAARKMAEAQGLDINQITGTGPGGRIVREDVEKAAAAKTAAPAAAPAPAEEAYGEKRVKATIPFTKMRKAIADHMVQSLKVSAQLTNMGEVDMTEIIRLRKRFLEQEEAIGVRISVTDIFIKVIAQALIDNPIFNSSLVDDEIKVWEDINIGVAVALTMGEYESGLIVPVVRQADKKSLVEVSRTVKELTAKAREGKLMPDDVADSTFTLTNAGMFGARGGIWSTPIINQPEAAILQTGPIIEKPVVREGQIVIRPIMGCAVTYDHRIIDGAPAVKFMARFVELMENPELLLL